MKKDKLRLYALEFILILILFLALFVSNNFSRTSLAVMLSLYAIITKILIKRKKATSIYKKQVAWLMGGFSAIYLIVFYMLGLYFGYYKAPTTLGLSTILKFILPFTLIIVSSEMIRKTLIVQKGKISKILVFISMVLIDLIIYSGVYDISKLDDMLTMVGFILFASIACNLLYNYITVRFSSRGVIIYRLVTVLYAYIIPYIPNIYLFFRSFLRMLYPYLIYLVLEYTYSKTNYAVEYKDKKKTIVGNSIMVIIMGIIIALISCQFKYGVLVIGSGSMTGALNKGDIVIYESYDGGAIKKGTIIIFNNDNIQTVHRVIDIENVNGEYRYYTKGDSNQQADEGYIVKEDIVGISRARVMYVGFPTIWLRDIFSKK